MKQVVEVGGLDIQEEMLALLDSALGLAGRGAGFSSTTPLLGALPEFDSMSVAGVLAALEDHFDIMIADEEIEGALFATVGSLVEYVQRKLAT